MQDDNGCGNCRHFLYEDTDGIGWCEPRKKSIYCGCGQGCPLWKQRNSETSPSYSET